jgi:ApbE superfamily uncharacterized protein (UPF0280 family)
MIVRRKIVIEDTIAGVITENRFIPSVVDEIKLRREELKGYIKNNPEFLTSLEPIIVSEKSPEIVKNMAVASKYYEVGPMAAVAGAIGYYAVQRVIREGGKHIVFDNGGDITMMIEKPIVIGIYTGNRKTGNYGIKIKPSGKIISIATSSGKIGHSLSLGKADAVSVISSNPFLADAAATSVCNKIKEPNSYIISKIIEDNLMDGVDGIMVIIDSLIGVSENFPKLIKVDMDYNLIARD